jgi:hypothetical protein
MVKLGKLCDLALIIPLSVALSACAVGLDGDYEQSGTDDTVTSDMDGDGGKANNIIDSAITLQCIQRIERMDDGPGGINWMPAAANNSTICFLAQGDVSGAVWALQRALKVCYGQNIATDSQFGPKTKQALINVQNQLHISADGGYGKETRTFMKFSRADLSEPDASDPRFCHVNGPVT